MRGKQENLILVALYPGPNAPASMNMFFRPLINELRTLYEGASSSFSSFSSSSSFHLVFVLLFLRFLIIYYFFWVFCYQGIQIVNSIDATHKTLKAQLLFATCDLDARRKV